MEVSAKNSLVKKNAKRIKGLEEEASQKRELIGVITKQLKGFAGEAVRQKEELKLKDQIINSMQAELDELKDHAGRFKNDILTDTEDKLKVKEVT